MENKDEFLPQDYKVPVSGGGYMKLKMGDNLVRIMSNPIFGYEYWTNETKPVRSEVEFTETPNIKLDKDGNPTKVKHFWAFIVWNYETKNIEILQINQSTIQSAITNLVKDEDWGNPKNYDLKITRTGEGFDTEYAVNPKPAKAVTEEVAQKYADSKIKLEALFDGGNPFEK